MRVAIFGCGQLSRMMALAGLPMGLSFAFIAEADEDSRCVDGLGEVIRRQPAMTPAQLYSALGSPDVVTVEREHVDTELLAELQYHCAIHPSITAIRHCQHRGLERQLLGLLNIPCANHAWGTVEQLKQPQMQQKLPLPAIIKSCEQGYDGNNQWRVHSADDPLWQQLAPAPTDYLVEQVIPFDRELSQLSVRDRHGNIQHYPLTENHHQNGILKHSLAPAEGISKQLSQQVQHYAEQLLEHLDYVGVLALECFVVGEQVLINELAPRVHNSGHWTQSGSATCQFENHIRAITGLPLGKVEQLAITGMVNLIGTPAPPLSSVATDCRLHWYDKSARPGRKLGHINIAASNHQQLAQRMQSIRAQCP